MLTVLATDDCSSFPHLPSSVMLLPVGMQLPLPACCLLLPVGMLLLPIVLLPVGRLRIDTEKHRIILKTLNTN